MKTTTHTAGFTLIELIITLSVAAILLSIAAPSFVDIIKDNRLVTQVNEFTASLNLAKSEAIKRSLPVTICKSSNQTSCTGNWHDGWIVFADLNGNGTVDTGGTDKDTILRVHSALTNGNTLSSSNTTAKNRVTYSSDGFATNYNTTFTLCDDRGITDARGVKISASGRVRVADSSELASCS